MVRFYNSLQFRLTVSFILLILLITGLTYFSTYNEAKKALKETVREELTEITGIASTQVKGDILKKMLLLKAGDEETAEYKEIAGFLLGLRKNSKDLANFYVLRREGDKMFFLADDAYLETPDDCAKIGEEYTAHDEALIQGFTAATASPEFYTDKWGTFLSGYAPLKDETGNTVAVIGVDMTVEKVLAKQKFIGSLLYIIIGLSIVTAGLIILFFSRTIIKDIKNLTKAASRISQGELDIQLPEIKSRNEIYELNEGLKSVVAAVEFLKDVAAEKNNEQKK
jgi:methyl-accepting chemotaxis protein